MQMEWENTKITTFSGPSEVIDSDKDLPTDTKTIK